MRRDFLESQIRSAKVARKEKRESIEIEGLHFQILTIGIQKNWTELGVGDSQLCPIVDR